MVVSEKFFHIVVLDAAHTLVLALSCAALAAFADDSDVIRLESRCHIDVCRLFEIRLDPQRLKVNRFQHFSQRLRLSLVLKRRSTLLTKLYGCGRLSSVVGQQARLARNFGLSNDRAVHYAVLNSAVGRLKDLRDVRLDLDRAIIGVSGHRRASHFVFLGLLDHGQVV